MTANKDAGNRMAPEVVKNEPYSAKVDIWSLGCTVIEMFTGQRPWLTLNQIATLYNVCFAKKDCMHIYLSDFFLFSLVVKNLQRSLRTFRTLAKTFSRNAS